MLVVFVANFEAALWQARKDKYPCMPIQGCVVHWTQAAFRKVLEHGLKVNITDMITFIIIVIKFGLQLLL